MIERYCTEKIKPIWEMQNKFEYYLKVELEVCKAQAECGNFPKSAVEEIVRRAKVSEKRIEEIEKETHHDVIAFITNLKESVGEELSKYIHIGLTSSDIIDTAFSMQIQASGKVILEDLDAVLEVLKSLVFKYKNTVCVGRTHGMHAEIMTFGLKLLGWYDILQRERNSFEFALENARVGQISGAVGTYSNISPEIEKLVCENLGLKPAKISTQIISRDVYAGVMQTLALIATVIEQFATEIRHLQRTEVMEVAEGFSKKQKGSSAMPHKKNPILSENLCGLSRVVRANSVAALENVVLWHERDISHSSAERVIFPDSMILVDFMLTRFKDLVENLVVYEDRMRENAEKFGNVVYSQKVCLKLIEKGVNDAYEITQKAGIDAILNRGDFKKNIEELNLLNAEELESCFDETQYLQNIDEIFSRFKLR
ncbi:adenylosuccinate lyase [bacterium]|nr:adenylosuccinate lyase [bacterium]